MGVLMKLENVAKTCNAHYKRKESFKYSPIKNDLKGIFIEFFAENTCIFNKILLKTPLSDHYS